VRSAPSDQPLVPGAPDSAPDGAPRAHDAAPLAASERQARDAAFERDVLRCLPDVARFARSLTRDAADADDLVQETFLRAYRGHHTFHAGHDARRWLFAICRHAHLRQRQRAERFVETDDGGDAELDALAAARGHDAAQRTGADDLFERLDVGPAIARALDELAEPFRVAVVLVDVEGQSYDAAAAIEGVPVGTIRSRLFRARRLLQEKLLAHARDAGLAAGLAAGPTPRVAAPRPPRRSAAPVAAPHPPAPEPNA
jgi:RNA polymerase sigma-70 factor (ECF subfamily)